MPSEDRKIIFTFEEVYKALYAMTVQKEMKKLPVGAIKSIAKSTTSSDQYTVWIEDDYTMESNEIGFGGDFLAAALMVFCRSQGIPMSKKARKSVEIDGAHLVLRLQI